MLTTRFTEAVDYARAHHATQVRKGTAIPYVAHLLAVSALVLEHGGDESAAVAALLHDVVEDGGGERALVEIGARLGADVAAVVEECSDTTAAVKEDWRVRKERYLEHLESAPPEVLLVSAADKLHNARSILADLRELGDALWDRFNRGAREQLWYYGSLRDVFCRRLPGRLADELDRTVRAVNLLVDPDERIDWLGADCAGWHIHGTPESGAIVDWPGWPLVIAKKPDGLHVHAEVGLRGDYCPDVDDDLEDVIELDLGDLRLEYREPDEVAWLVGQDRGDLCELCDRIAALAPTVATRLRGCWAELDAPLTTHADRLQHGPWWSRRAPGGAASPRPIEQELRPRALVEPDEPGAAAGTEATSELRATYYWLSDDVLGRIKDGWRHQVWQPGHNRWIDFHFNRFTDGYNNELTVAQATAQLRRVGDWNDKSPGPFDPDPAPKPVPEVVRYSNPETGEYIDVQFT
jgi:hypothetical protein